MNLANVELHQQYLLSLLKSKSGSSADDPEPSLHDIHVSLNKLSGMYWLICGYMLTSESPDPKILQIFRTKFMEEFQKSRKFVDENGGPLRCLSAVQLAFLLLSEDEALVLTSDITDATVEFFVKYFSEPALPFWFDMRSVYCLISVLHITNRLDEITHVKQDIISYINSAQSILGGFGAGPKAEAHGGYTFCAVASLTMLHSEVRRRPQISQWLTTRLSQLNGRPGKPADSCYIWWVGASLFNLNEKSILERERDRLISFLNNDCFVPGTGGFSKFPSVPFSDQVHGKQDADLFHTFLALASIALINGRICPLVVLPK